MNAKQFSCYGQSAISWPSLPGAARQLVLAAQQHIRFEQGLKFPATLASRVVSRKGL
jgi:hypothetical protein